MLVLAKEAMAISISEYTQQLHQEIDKTPEEFRLLLL